MVFLDGVGIGKNDSASNPFFKYEFKSFTKIFGKVPSLDAQYINREGVYLFPTDAKLGVSGLPQSGTGQTSLLCGINAPALINKHFGPFPYSTLIPIIKEKNIFAHLKSLDKKVFFANAYPKIFFDYITSGKTRLSTTSLSCRLSGVRLNNVTDVRKAYALTAEITGERWNKKLGYKLPVIKPAAAARRLLKIASQNDFTLYEYFLTDHLGHGRIADEFDNIVTTLDEFLFTLISNIEQKEMTMIICSDHGNFEDISVKTHTLNPALTITAGYNADKLAGFIKNISQFKSAIIRYCL
jgi:hypothetical protein